MNLFLSLCHTLVGLIAVAGLLLPLAGRAADPTYAGRAEVPAFIAEMETEGFDPQALTALFDQAEYKQSIVDAISRPAERTLTWKGYQDIFLTELRAKRGRAFINENAEAFTAAESKYGVPTEIVAAIIGVETMYGRIRGNYRVIDSLSTLAFDYPPRAKFFRSELKHFLRLTREEKQDARLPKGSYAGAMGYGQFISSSYRNYAVDFDGDGVRDIWNNKKDAIGSVANYLARHGWNKGELIVVKAMLSDSIAETDSDEIFNISLKPSVTIAHMKSVGVEPLSPKSSRAPLSTDTKVSPILLRGKQGDEHWLGLQNFYVITRYNHSKLYAMAVFQLSEQLSMKNKR